jgi:hypothetical protein
MSQATNDYLYEILGTQGFPFGEDLAFFAGASITIGGAYPIKSQCHRIVQNAVANAALMLKSILSNDNPQLVFLINESPNTAVIFPFKNFAAGAIDTTETVNGVQTGFSLTTLNSVILVSSLVQVKRKGGSQVATLNWSASLIT